MGALPLCRRWLEDCYASHPHCQPDKKLRSIIPTRLLEIGNGELRIRLADEVTRTGQNIRYATLSHCWGTKTFTTLISANLESFRQQIPTEAITKTFADAIHIARAVGFGYLWIDSLCIIQDSAEDWERESARMAQVYGASDLTIAATFAENGSGGCFANRDPNWRCQVRQSKSPVLLDVYQWIHLEPHYINSLDFRAWALQERYLSRRMLHFAKYEVFWECDANPACETYLYGYPPWVREDEILGFTLKKRPLTRQNWPAIVEDYSGRKLTKTSDIFPAIGGLARLIQEQSKDEYVAGMWREGLEDQLAWYSFNYTSVTVPYIAPSWSWAATTKRIEYPRDDEVSRAPSKLYIGVDSVDMQYATSDLLGRLVAAKLRLRCDALCCGVVRPPDSFRLGKKIMEDAWVSIDAGKSWNNGHDVHILVIRHGTARMSLCTGLLLEPTNRMRGEYRRIGSYGFKGGVYRASPGVFKPMEDPDFEKLVSSYEEFAELVAEENLVARDCVDHFAHVSTAGGVKRYFIDLV